MNHDKLWSLGLFMLATLIFLGGDATMAFAQSAVNWEQPAVDLANVLEGGLVRAGAVIVGIGIILIGITACAMGKMDWSRITYVLIGGVLVMAGPEAIRLLLSSI